MSPSSSRFTTEHILYALAVALALTVRLWGLGRAPLGENEAVLALQALDVAARHPAALGPAPLLTALTGLGFFLFGSTNAVARLVPALLGGLLPLLAWPLRKALGRRAALLFAFALALDPGLVALSRMADSPIPAALALSAAVLAAARARWDWALPLAALGVLLGPAFWQGLLALALAAALLRVLGYPLSLHVPPEGLRHGAVRAAALLALGSTLAFWTPEGLGAVMNSLVAFIQKTFLPTGTRGTLLIVALLAYAPLALVAGLAGAVSAFLHKRLVPALLALTSLAAFVLTMLSPGRQPADLVWVLLPLWGLAAWALARLPRLNNETLWQAAVITLLLVFSWLSLVAWSRTPVDSRAYRLTLLLSLAGFLLAFLLGSLLATSWKDHQSWNQAFGGLTWGLTVALAALTLSALFHAAYGPRPRELWYLSAVAPQQRLLAATIADLGQQHHGLENTLEISVITPPGGLPSLRWLLRNDPNARFTSALPAEARPEAVLASSGWTPKQESAYRGQAFALYRVPPLQPDTRLQQAVQWLAFRPETPAGSEVILWVRNDLFPDNETK